MTETTSTSRVPAGVPTGGQFAASAKAESGVALTGQGTPTPGQVEIAQARVTALRESAERLDDLVSLAVIRDQARDEFGAEATYLAVSQRRDEDGVYLFVTAYDTDFNELDNLSSSPEPLHHEIPERFHIPAGTRLPDNIFATAWLDTAALDRLDLAAETREAEMSLAADAVNSHARASLIIDDAYIAEQAQEHAFSGTYDHLLGESDLTEAEQAQILDEFDAQAVNFDRPWNDFHNEVDRATETVLRRTRRRG